jgi:hypothetical protein
MLIITLYPLPLAMCCYLQMMMFIHLLIGLNT